MTFKIPNRHSKKHGEWGWWFALLPVRINDEEIVWLQWVKYRCHINNSGSPWSFDCCDYEYQTVR